MGIIFHPFYVGFPLLILLLFLKPKHKVSAGLNLLFVCSYTYIIYTANNWIGHLSYYLRYLPIIISIILFFKTAFTFKSLTSGYNLLANIPKAALTTLFLIYIFEIHEPSVYPEHSIELSFPLKNGNYIVTQGGKTHYINYHLKQETRERQAIDIGKINTLGSPLHNLLQDGSKNDQFIIFRDSVFSPCNGVIIKINNQNQDHEPNEVNKFESENPNLINISHRGFNIILAHFLKESIPLEVGDSVKKGDFLGLVGNSGQSTAPHLHIHAERKGMPAIMFFNQQYLIKNSLVSL